MEHWTVIGVFDQQKQAQTAISELKQAGFSDEEIGYVFRQLPVVLDQGKLFPGEPLERSQQPEIVEDASSSEEEETTKLPVIEAKAEQPPEVKDGASEQQPQETMEQVSAPDETGDASAYNGSGDVPVTTRETMTGAVTGSIVGGAVGAAAALFIPVLGPALAGGILAAMLGAALGAVAGGALGAFVAMGVPEEQARHYEQELVAGRTIVTVNTVERRQDALDILNRNGANYANAHDSL